ncbi:hypothetical protein JCM8097_005334 [Rhodosporidiobolus ruineniae]
MPALPPELIGDVLLHLALEPYQARQRTLLHCCLVSHTFRAVAQPLLRAVVHVSGFEDRLDLIEEAAEADPSFGQAVRALELTDADHQDSSAFELARRFERLLELDASGGVSAPTFSDLAGWFPDLRHLTLADFTVSLNSPNCPTFNFSSLRSLSLTDLCMREADLTNLLSDRITPSLRALRLGSIRNIDTENAGLLFLRQPPSLKRLEFFQTGLERYTSDLERLASPPAVLSEIQCNMWYSPTVPVQLLNSLKPRHLHLTFWYDPQRVEAFALLQDYLNSLAAWTRTKPYLLSLSLPASFCPSLITHSDVRQQAEAALAAWHAGGVEVVWRPEAADDERDPRLDHEFWRAWYAAPAALAPSTSSSSPPHLDTPLLVHRSRTVLVRRPPSLHHALATSRHTFRLGEAADVRLEVEWGGDRVELTDEVWNVVQAGSRVTVRVVDEEGAADKAAGKKRSVAFVEEEREDGVNPKKARVEAVKQSSLTTQNVKGKRKAVDQNAGEKSDSSADFLRLARGDLQKALALKSLVLAAATSSSSSAPVGVCPHGLPFADLPAAEPTDGEMELSSDHRDPDTVLVKLHSGVTLLELPCDPWTRTRLTIQSLYNLVDRRLTDGAPCSLIYRGDYLDRDKGWKELSRYGVQAGRDITVCRGEECVVRVWVKPRQETLYIPSLFSSERSEILSIVSEGLDVPLSDLYLSSRRWSGTISHPPFPDDVRLEADTPLVDEDQRQLLWEYGLGPVVQLEVWIMSEAQEDKKGKGVVSGEGGGSGPEREVLPTAGREEKKVDSVKEGEERAVETEDEVGKVEEEKVVKDVPVAPEA